MFRDRQDAALQLAQRLTKYKGQKPLVLGIPRGGIAVAATLARELGGELDIILTRKLRTPGNPELAMGSIDESGNVYLNESVVNALRIPEQMIEEERERQVAMIRARAESYRRIRPKIPLEGRIAILTDDGIATGSTMRAAIQVAKAAKPQKLLVALPVGPPEQVAELEPEVDEMVCLYAPPDFMAVGQFYESFGQLEDEDVERILRDSMGGSH
ncbi:MAG: phosphoribosyltransferase [Candidatus Abyssobacteria bacterium SURF_17]|jgi:predicted phosphoribosyltransferase|uniref:Phosphoribosyltransferase n=1 Tax=Candidatus Abyssobacteria bacterium SURF_17 TaxID=2093361 RepID=A0A419ETX9_9BACT|nr:MAG: phosphoribosyltransferase [Candidatus Abyssubacteria bacterium SURF_17]